MRDRRQSTTAAIVQLAPLAVHRSMRVGGTVGLVVPVALRAVWLWSGAVVGLRAAGCGTVGLMLGWGGGGSGGETMSRWGLWGWFVTKNDDEYPEAWITIYLSEISPCVAVQGPGRDFGWGKLRPPILVPCWQLRKPQSLGYTADIQTNLGRYTLGTQNHSSGQEGCTRKKIWDTYKHED